MPLKRDRDLAAVQFNFFKKSLTMGLNSIRPTMPFPSMELNLPGSNPASAFDAFAGIARYGVDNTCDSRIPPAPPTFTGPPRPPNTQERHNENKETAAIMAASMALGASVGTAVPVPVAGTLLGLAVGCIGGLIVSYANCKNNENARH